MRSPTESVKATLSQPTPLDLRFTIPSLTPGTNVTEISVSAYTSVGRGDPVQTPYLVTTTRPSMFIFLYIIYCVLNYCS